MCRRGGPRFRSPALRLSLAQFLYLALLIAACSPRGGAARNSGTPTPVEEPAPGPGTASPPQTGPGNEGAEGLPERRVVPVRPDQAPLVHIRQALEADSLLGRRVRVAGRCTAVGDGQTAGSWILKEGRAAIEVRGLVPSSCGARTGEDLTIFAQVEPKTSGSKERLLLRLPD